MLLYMRYGRISVVQVQHIIEQTTINVMINNNISSSNFSNFIIVDQKIYFAIGSTIVVLDILDSIRYLVIRDSDRDHILDTKTNFSLIFNISSGIADILAILHIISNTSAITPSPPSTTTESAPSSRADEVLTSDSTVVSTDIQTDIPSTIPITEQSKSTDLQLALIVVSSIAVVVIIINIIAITVYFFKRYRKHHR